MPATAPPFHVWSDLWSQTKPTRLLYAETSRVPPGARWGVLEAERVPGPEAPGRARGRAPARATLERLLELAGVRAPHRGGAGVKTQTSDHREGVPRIGVDRDPFARALLAPLQEAAGVQRLIEQAAAVERVGDAAGAVVAVVLELTVAAAIDVWLVLDQVRGPDRLLHLRRRVGRRGGRPVRQQMRDRAGNRDVLGRRGRRGNRGRLGVRRAT